MATGEMHDKSMGDEVTIPKNRDTENRLSPNRWPVIKAAGPFQSGAVPPIAAPTAWNSVFFRQGF